LCVRSASCIKKPTAIITQNREDSVRSTSFPTMVKDVVASFEGANGQASAARCTASGYSRRGNRSPRLCFKTVRASFPAHGSSVVRPLSWAPCWACDLQFCASPSPGHPYIARWRAHGLCRATHPDHLRTTVPTSAYPRAFPATLASWGIPPPCRMRLTPAPPGGAQHGVTPFLTTVCRCM
jgi:hypothetical protein